MSQFYALNVLVVFFHFHFFLYLYIHGKAGENFIQTISFFSTNFSYKSSSIFLVLELSFLSWLFFVFVFFFLKFLHVMVCLET